MRRAEHAETERVSHRVHCVVEIREGLAYARPGLAFGQPPGDMTESW